VSLGATADIKETPNKWLSGSFGIPPTTNLEEYESAYIKRKIWENNIIKKVRSEYPDETQITTFFPSSQPDKYLPVVGRMAYIYRKPNSSAMRTYGTLLTKEQRDALLYKGIEPEDIEIVFIDGDYNILSEKPKPYNHAEWVKANTYLTAYDGVTLTPENYEEVMGYPVPERWQKWYEKNHPGETWTVPQAFADEDADGMRAAAREAAAAERVKFEQGLRELERLMNMSNAEIAAELEQRFTPRLPELPTDENLENRLWSEIQSNLMTPARFEAAFRILE